jgi:putative membrane protein
MEISPMTTASLTKPVTARRYPLPYVLGVVFLCVWVASGINPILVEDWWLENLLVILGIGVLVSTYRRFTFSELSYLLIFIYLCMHEWGAHYRYAFVPLGEWMRVVFHTVRNDYDRVVHFAFGALLAYPQREILMRKANVRGAWSLWLPLVTTLGLGAAYEIMEAVVAVAASPDAGEAFLGLQGDPWDTHKDMFVAFAGAALAMTITYVAARIRRTKDRAALAAR